MRTSRAAGLAIAVGVAALGAWALLRPPDSGPPADAGQRPFEGTPAAPSEATVRLEQAAADRAVEGANATPTAGEGFSPSDRGRLVVTVVAAPSGSPLAGADVSVAPDSGTWRRDARTDAAGEVRFEGLASDTVAIEARAPGRVLETSHVSDLEAGERRVTLALEPGIALEGVVLASGTGRALADAEVVARRGGAIEGMSVSYDGPPLVRTRSDEAGRFRVDGIPLGEVVSIDADVPGYVPSVRSLLLGEGSRDHPPVEIRLAPAAVVSGRVVLPDGSPAEGAHVFVTAVDTDGDAREFDARLGPLGMHFDHGPTATTDAEGAYVLDGLPSRGSYRLFARKAGLARSAPSDPPTRVDGPGPVRVRDLVLRRPSTLTVRVVGPGGVEVEEAQVWIDVRGFDLVPSKDPTGVPRFQNLPPGTYEVRVTKRPFVTGSRTVVVGEGSTVEERVVLERGVAIEGVLVDDAGGAVANAGVAAYRETDDDPSGGGGGASTDAEGRFRIEGLRPGSYRLKATAGGHGGSPPVSASAPGSGARLVVRRAGRLRMRLVVPGGAVPPARVGVHVEDLDDDGGGVGSQEAWADGRVEIDDVTSNRVRIGLSVPGFAPVVREEEVVAGGERDLGDVVLGPGVELTGRVVDGTGAPRRGARVRVILPTFLDDAVATTDAQGRFRVPLLPPGEQFVRVEAEGCVPGAERVEPSQSPVTFTLVPGVVVRGVVTGLSKASLDDAHVFFRREGEAPPGVPRERSDSLDSSGAFEVLVAAGSHAVTVERLPGNEVLHRLPAPVSAPRAEPLSIEVR